jgi:drug/metabolite transporter (DMT)-like permease
MLIGTAFQLPLVLVDLTWFELSTFSMAQVTWRGLGGILFLTLITAYVNYLLWYIVTARYDVTKSAVVTNAHFLVTVLAESIIVGGVLSGMSGIGIGIGSAILFAGVAMASTARESGSEGVSPARQSQAACSTTP